METSLNKLDRDFCIQCYFGAQMEQDPDFNPKMFVPSKWDPPPTSLQPELRHCLTSLKNMLTASFTKQRGHRNLLPHQLKALSWLQQQDDLMVVHCDKNLGPAIIEKTKCLSLAMRDHLSNTVAYRRITEVDAAKANLYSLFDGWLKEHKKHLSKQEL